MSLLILESSKQLKTYSKNVALEFTKEKKMEAKDLKVLQNYIASRKKYGYSDEELFEMRASFGEDEEVVDIFTGQTIDLGRSS
jgi:DNA-binding transcriptional regulator YhcF (GntR family)